MNNMQPTAPQWICEHCYIHLVNGDCTEPFAEGDPDVPDPLHLFSDMHVTPGMLGEEHDCIADECDCETNTYSTRSCDGCGSEYHGARYAVTGWIKSN